MTMDSASTETPRRDPPARRVRAALLSHYRRARRELPWRGETDPYRIWVSEVMLQQTRVDTVLHYYDRWLERFPDVVSLADAPMDDVLLAWQGLGYYRRARNLHKAAAVVRDRHGGAVPGSYEALRELPGVGEYTAGAVASIGFGVAVPAVDGNVRRVMARLWDEPLPGAAWLRRKAALLVDPECPGDWNQALMDLGATICTPTTPRCEACPLAPWCRARDRGTQSERPAPPKRRAVPSVELVSAVVIDGGGRALVERRPQDGLLGGMWSFPTAEGEGGASVEDTARAVAERAGAEVAVTEGRTLAAVRHRFTHLDASYRPVMLRGAGEGGEGRRWIPLQEPWSVALPVAQQKIARAAQAALRRPGEPSASGGPGRRQRRAL